MVDERGDPEAVNDGVLAAEVAAVAEFEDRAGVIPPGGFGSIFATVLIVVDRRSGAGEAPRGEPAEASPASERTAAGLLASAWRQ